MTTKRQRLEAAVIAGMDRAGRAEMQWGRDDCALWVADIIQDALGYDPAAPFRGHYTTRLGAMRAMGPKGMLGVARSAARRHKWKRINPEAARPGDVGLAWTTAKVPGWVTTSEGKRVKGLVEKPVLASVICRSRGWFVARNEHGWTAAKAEHVAHAWSVLDDHRPGSRVNLNSQMKLMPQAVHEPVSATIGLTALITSLGASAPVAGAIGGFIVTSALSIGVSLVASLLQPQQGTGALDSSLANTNATQSSQVSSRQAVPFQRVIVGGAFVGGPFFFEQVKPPYLTVGTLLNRGAITAVDYIWIGTNKLVFNSLPFGSSVSPIGIDGQPDYANRLTVSLKQGLTTDGVDPLILADYPNVGATFKQEGIATAVLRYHFGGTDTSAATQAAFTALWGNSGRPQSYFFIRGVVAYDPRDPTQDIDDESTWAWTNNATLVQAYYLTRSWGGRIPMAKVLWDKIADSADYDDEVIACGNGTLIKRHTIDGVITLNQRPSEVIPKMLTANRAWLLEAGGKIWIESSRPKTASVTIHDGILATAIKYTGGKPKADLVNKMQVRIVAPDQDYQLTDGPVLDRTDLQTIDQETLTGTLSLDYTLDTSPNVSRVQRLQKAFLESARLGRTITCSVDAGKILAIAPDELVGSVATFDSELFDNANGTYRITSVGFSDDFTTISLAMTEYDASIETAWDPTTDEQDFELTPVDVS